MLRGLCLVTLALISSYGQVLAGDWQELKGEHFIVYYKQSDEFARNVLNKAEDCYRFSAQDLGYSRVSDFWTWNKRVKIYIYNDHESFLTATSQPSWSQGSADYTNKMISSYAWSDGFLESLLPHEITHLVFRDFVGFKGEVPLWLDEGVAQWEEQPKRKALRRVAKDYLANKRFYSLSQLMRMDHAALNKKADIGPAAQNSNTSVSQTGQQKDDAEITTFYIQSASLVGFLVERYGSESFTVFCRQLRDGKSLEEALNFSYASYMKNINELEKKWMDFYAE